MSTIETKPLFAVSLIGGGIRGILQARLLERLETYCPGFLAVVGQISGTSIGGINALFLAKYGTTIGLVDMFRNYADKIFATRDWLDAITRLDELTRADFGHEGLKEALLSIFTEIDTLGELSKKVVITAIDTDNMDEQSVAQATRHYKLRQWKPKYMDNYGGPDDDLSLIDVALRTSSAPTYFPAYQGYVDGGLVDNNPAVAGLASAVHNGSQLKDIWMLCVGTGINPNYVDAGDWGYRQWLKGGRLLNMIFDVMIPRSNFQAEKFLPKGQFHALDVKLPEPIDLADVSKVDELVELADSVNLTKTIDWLGRAMEAVQGCAA